LDILEKLGLVKKLTIKKAFDANLFLESFLKFKQSKSKLKLLYSEEISPSDIESLNGNEFRISKFPRLLNPWSSSGDVHGTVLTGLDSLEIVVKVYSWYPTVIFLEVFTLLLFFIGITYWKILSDRIILYFISFFKKIRS
jgi:hypothetical protein